MARRTGGFSAGLGALLGLADRPAVGGGFARQATALVVALRLQDGAAVALAELARLEHLEHPVREVEDTNEVGDRGAAAADRRAELLLAQPELVEQLSAGAGRVDGVEVLADHVLDQRHLQALGLGLVADDRGDGLGRPPGRRASGARRRSARSGRRAGGGRAAAGRRRSCRSTRPGRGAPGSNVVRGWLGFGRIISTGISRNCGASCAGSGRIAARPRPMPRRSATGDDLFGERQIGLGADRRRRVLADRQAEARRLGETDAARDDGGQD